jgi:hypothetical protein
MPFDDHVERPGASGQTRLDQAGLVQPVERREIRIG